MNTKLIIETNKYANESIKQLEEDITSYFNNKKVDDKSKANFANLCTALTGFRLIESATSALLSNEDIVVTEDGKYYQKIDEAVDLHNDEAAEKEQ